MLPSWRNRFLIFTVNQLADFYMRATLSLNGLKNKSNKKKTKINQFIIFLRYLRESSIYHFLPLLTSLERYYKDKLRDNSSIGNTICLWAIRKCLCPLLVNLVVSKVWLFFACNAPEFIGAWSIIMMSFAGGQPDWCKTSVVFNKTSKKKAFYLFLMFSLRGLRDFNWTRMGIE